jgi:predicted nucleic acid-binding protein
MKIIVDANIVFSAILNTNSKIADILLNSKKIIDFLAPDFLLTEINKYHKKISLISKLPIDEVQRVENQVTKPILFLSGFHIPEKLWIKSEQLVKDIDPKDTAYLAFSLYFKCMIWSGDKELRTGLLKKGFNSVITTEELFDIRELHKSN